MGAAQRKLMAGLPIVLAVSVRTRSASSRRNFEFGHRLFYCVTGVIFWIRFICGAMLCYLADDLFGVVTEREGAFCESPVVLGLA